MAERRMFAKTIIDSDAFLDMPLSSQALYFHLSMRADDDGFINNPKKIQRMVNCSDDDMKILFAKCFVIPFESGIVVIKHWKINNYIQNDRYKPTLYQEEKKQLKVKDNGAYATGADYIQENPDVYTECIQDVSKVDTQVRIGKDSLDKDSLGKVSLDKSIYCSELCDSSEQAPAQNVPAIILNDGSEWVPDAKDLEEWKSLYSGVDVIRELGKARQWCLSNPTKRKTKRGARRFITNWLDRAQNDASRKSGKRDKLEQKFEEMKNW